MALEEPPALPRVGWVRVSQRLCLLWPGGAAEAGPAQGLGPAPPWALQDCSQARARAGAGLGGLGGGGHQSQAMTPGTGGRGCHMGAVGLSPCPVPPPALLSPPSTPPLADFGEECMRAYAQPAPQFFFSIHLCFGGTFSPVQCFRSLDVFSKGTGDKV